MISRYKRKPVSQTLEINQTLLKSAEGRPPPEKVDNASTSRGGERYLENSEQESSTDVSGNSELKRNDTEVSWPEFQSCAGLSTDNSSVISWGFDEFDQAATRQVQKIFKQIDELLYEQRGSTLVEGLQEECHQWMSFFPHLRVQGRQVVNPTDDGFSWYPSQQMEAANTTTSSSAHGKDPTELGIFGIKCPLSTSSDGYPPVLFSLYDDEDDDDVGVIMSDGVMEEYLAFDSRDKDDELFEWNRVMSLDSLKMGYPPISPRYCKKEAVLACLFDDVWKEAVGCLEELICRHWEESITDDDRNDIAIKTTRADVPNPYAPPQRLPLVLPPVPHSRIPAISPSVCLKCKHILRNQKKGKHSHGNRSHGGSMMNQRNLNDLIMIHGIPLQQRNLHLMEKVLDSDDKSPMRPTSSSLISGKPRPGRPLEHSSSSLSHNVPSARRRNPPRTLHPISNNTNISRSGTPKIEGVLQGTRIQTGNEQVPCSPVSINRNNLLPPIGTLDAEYHYLPGSQRHTPDNPLGRSFVNPELSNLLHFRRGSDGIGMQLILKPQSRSGALAKSRQGH
ncbi:primary cilium assembly protein FAM149B1 [Gastrophryne carolinensis]